MSLAPGAAGAADAVHVIFGHVRDFVVHDMGQVVDVDAARGDVGGHERADLSVLETFERIGARRLALVAVQRHGRHAILFKIFGHIVGAELGAREHQHLAPVLLLDDVQQHRLLPGTAHGVDDLPDALHRGVARCDLDALGTAQQAAREFADFVAEGRRKQQALLVARQQRKNLLHVVNEAHVQHPVGFIEHQRLHAGKIEQALLLQIQQPSGRGDEHVHATLDALDLRVHANAAENHGRADVQVFRVGTEGFLDLRGQFARRRQNQGADRRVPARRRGVLREVMKDGQRKGRRLSRARLGPGEQVRALQDQWNGLRLYRCRIFVAQLLHGAQQGWCQVQFFKCHLCVCTHPGRGYQPEAAVV